MPFSKYLAYKMRPLNLKIVFTHEKDTNYRIDRCFDQ